MFWEVQIIKSRRIIGINLEVKGYFGKLISKDLKGIKLRSC